MGYLSGNTMEENHEANPEKKAPTGVLAKLEQIAGRKLTVRSAGKCVCEAQHEDEGGGWLVMTPDGEVTFGRNRGKAQAICNKYFESHRTADIGIGTIEWRT
jgi:hypothetical protein